MSRLLIATALITITPPIAVATYLVSVPYFYKSYMFKIMSACFLLKQDSLALGLLSLMCLALAIFEYLLPEHKPKKKPKGKPAPLSINSLLTLYGREVQK